MRIRRGVCQDFAHLQLACLRALTVPARYVSGYLLTHPAPGKEKLIGSDASHAWLAVWCEQDGWIDLDPTNNSMPAGEHITLAWGRDYGDVSPINGVIFGGGEHIIDVGVDVTPVSD
jgi:transglutaminase-like putative cysteine protease